MKPHEITIGDLVNWINFNDKNEIVEVIGIVPASNILGEYRVIVKSSDCESMWSNIDRITSIVTSSRNKI